MDVTVTEPGYPSSRTLTGSPAQIGECLRLWPFSENVPFRPHRLEGEGADDFTGALWTGLHLSIVWRRGILFFCQRNRIIEPRFPRRSLPDASREVRKCWKGGRFRMPGCVD